MNKHTVHKILCLTMLLVVGTLASACGGGGSSGGGGGGGQLVATFVPNTPTPSPNTMNLANGGSNGAMFTVLVQVTSTNDFFGAGFRITFDSASAQYMGFSSAGSFLDDNGNTVFFDVEPVSAGEIKVSATIQDASQPAGVDVGGSQTLIALNFQATTATAANAFNFSNVLVQICPTQQGACSDGNLTLSGGVLNASQ